MRQITLVAGFLLFTAVRVAAQQYAVHHWGIEQGLSQGINQKILRDASGFIWVTSYEGANRFDGRNFHAFYSIPEKRNAIRGIETVGLVQDSAHCIWIGSGDGLNRYDPVTDSMTYFFTEKLPGIRANYIVPIAATASEVICFDITGVVSGFDIHTARRRIISRAVSWFNSYTSVNNSWLDQVHNVLWMPAARGLVSIDLGRGNTITYLGDVTVNSIAHDALHGMLVIGTPDGYVNFNPITRAQQAVKQLHGIALGQVTATACDQAGNTWIGTEQQGLFRIAADGMVMHLARTESSSNGLTGNKINSLYCDPGGVTWVGIGTNGIDQLVPGNRFLHFAENRQDPNSLSNNVVRSFASDARGRTWIATQGGLNIYEPGSGQLSSYTTASLPGLPSNLLRSVIANQEGSIAWVATESGLCRIDTRTLIAQRISFTAAGNRLSPDLYIEQLIPFQHGSLLIATKEAGLFQLDPGADTARQLAIPGNKHVFYAAYVNNLLFLSVWDDEPAIYRIDPGGEKKWERIDVPLTSYLITYVVHDSLNHRYWIGTLKGLLETNEQLGIIRHYTVEDGLSNHYIYAIVMDQRNNLWISTNKGISHFDTRTRAFRVFNPGDGLQDYEYNAKACFRAPNGAIYFGGISGFDLIREGAMTPSSDEARFYIRDLLVNNVAFRGINEINHTASLSLPFSGNNITIQTGIIDFTTRGNNRIRYRLEGADADWRVADRDFVINYSNLAPGSYTFRATAASGSNQWNAQETSLVIVIAQPWWRSWWFYTAIIGAVLALIIAVLVTYFRRKLETQRLYLERQRAIEQERTRIATDMHDDLGAGLSRIRFLGETIDMKTRQQQAIGEDIDKIKTYSHEMISKMGEIVWALNQKNDTLSDLLSFTRSYAVDYLGQHDIVCRVTAPDEFPVKHISGELRRNIYLTVKEALHNVVKHAGSSQVTLDIGIAEHLLQIKIRDNGRGFDQAQLRKFSNGLANMNKRVQEMGGKLLIDGTAGTTVDLHVPIGL